MKYAVFFSLKNSNIKNKMSTATSLLSALWAKYDIFGSIVHNRAIVYKHQNFLKVVVHVIIIDQCNQTAR